MISLGNRKRFVFIIALYHDFHTSGVYATEPCLISERGMAFKADPKLYVFGGTLCPEIGWYTYAEIDWYTFKEIVWYTLEEIRQ